MWTSARRQTALALRHISPDRLRMDSVEECEFWVKFLVALHSCWYLDGGE